MTQDDRPDGAPRICVLLNSSAGKKRDKSEHDDLLALFRAKGAPADIRTLTKDDDIGEVVKQTQRENYDIIVAAGGDGTVAGAAAAMKGAKAAFGVIPFGTFNYFSRSLNIPEDPEGAVDAIVNGAAKSLRLATLNGVVFLNNANFGVYPDMLAEREATYSRWGRSRIAAYWAILTTLTRLPKPLALSIKTPNARLNVRTPVAFVFNNAFQLRQMGLEGVACIEEGKLAVLVSRGHGRWGLIKNGFALALGKATRGDDFSLICAEEVEITAKRKSLRVARDGERQRMKGPYVFELHHDAIRVMAPKEVLDQVR